MSALRNKSVALLRRLPMPVRQRLAAARRGAEAGYASVMGAVFRSAPVRSRAIVRERIAGDLSVVRPLDYSGNGILLHVDSVIELTTRLRSCAKEPETVRWIETFVRPGDVVFDIGANVGVYSFVIDRHLGGKAKVYAFEPGAATFLQLTRNIALNGCEDRIVPVAVGFGAETRLATFNYSSTAPGAALHAVDSTVDAHGKTFVPAMRQPIMLYSLDDFIVRFRIEQPCHMKIDVDGSELDILRGGLKTLGNPRLRTIMVELEPTSPTTVEAKQILSDAGFMMHSVASHGSATETSNFLFLRAAE